MGYTNDTNESDAIDALSNIECIRSLAESGSLLSRAQIEKLSKDQVIDYMLKRDTLSAALNSLASAFEQLTKRLDRSEATVAILKNCNQKLTDKCTSLEKRLTAVERSSNGPHLKQVIFSILSLTDEKIIPSDLDKCHVLGKGVIIEFVRREKRDALLCGRKNLKNKKNELKSMKFEKLWCLSSFLRDMLNLTMSAVNYLKQKVVTSPVVLTADFTSKFRMVNRTM